MTTRIAMLMANATDAQVCFATDGAPSTLRDLVVAAAAVEARLTPLDGERWALDVNDVFDFTAALLGCWAAGRTAVVAPAALLATAGAVRIDGVIETVAGAVAAPQRVAWTELVQAPRALSPILASSALVLYTSGSTGAPKKVARRLAHVESELLALERVFGASLGACRVLATVSHRHVYGLLFRVLWPLLARRSFATFDLEFPEQLLGAAGEGNVLVASPALLKRIGHLPAGAGRWRAVFSSGGMLPSDAAAAAARTLGVRPIEVLGSTETSGVAWRPAGAPTFAPLPSVEIRRSDDELLEVRSPFSGDEGWVRTGDRVHLHADGGIELLGRADRVAKIEDKRISLAEIESCLCEHAWIQDAAAVALDDAKRQYVGVVVELTAEGREALAERGRRALRTELIRALRGRIDNVALPRAFRYCDAIPTNAQDKRQAALLAALFAPR